jgi:hypothetical protein
MIWLLELVRKMWELKMILHILKITTVHEYIYVTMNKFRL